MIDVIFVVKIVHVIGAAVLFGTGLAIAFFMLMAHRTRSPAVIAYTAGVAMIAGAVFMLAAIVVAPVSGFALATAIGLSPADEPWMTASVMLYAAVCLCWLGAAYLQIRMRDAAREATAKQAALPQAYYRQFRLWAVLAWAPAIGLIAIFVLMTWQPHW